MSVPASQKAIITAAAQKYGIDPKILYGVYGTETGFGSNLSTSSAGAVGPFQFEPGTAKSLGIDPYDFKQAAYGAARYLSQYKSRGVAGMLSAYNAGPAGGLQQGYVDTTLKNAAGFGSAPSVPAGAPVAAATKLPGVPKEVESLDKPAFEKAQKASLVGKLLASEGGSSDNPLLLSGLATTKAPLASEYQTSKVVPSTPEAKKTPVEPANGVHLGKALPKGLSQFGDKKVAAWIDPILKYAQQHGWKGSVQSGYRSKAEQERIYNSGVRPAAVPGTSNHEGDEFPRGAVDVSEAQRLSEIIKHSPYAGTLVWAGSKDPVHFSHPHNGSY